MAASLATWLVAAASASAADLYVDRDVGAGGNPDCLIADPCETIAEALTEGQSTPFEGDIIHVGRSTAPYPAVQVPDLPVNFYALVGGAYDFSGPAATRSILDGGTSPGIDFLDGPTFRSIRGFTIRGGHGASNASLVASDATNITVANNVFDDDNNDMLLVSYIRADGSPQITGNTINGDDGIVGDVVDRGIDVNGAVGPFISSNVINNVQRGIDVAGSATTVGIGISDNTITPRNDGGLAAGIYLDTATGFISENLITDSSVSGTSTAGIYSTGNTTGSLNLVRNRVFGMGSVGVWLLTPDPATLTGDAIIGNGTDGISPGVHDAQSPAALALTNVTVRGNGGSLGEITVDDPGSLTIDSSIIGENGVDAFGGPPDATCTTTFSRGPASSELCTFATNAVPSFAPGANDFHLTENGNAALIDMGNPAIPFFNLTDLDGDPRAVSGAPCTSGAGRRDIGADEVVPSCPPPATAAASTPMASSAACPKGKKLVTLKKKKKKGKKKKKKCVKKKRKKKGKRK